MTLTRLASWLAASLVAASVLPGCGSSTGSEPVIVVPEAPKALPATTIAGVIVDAGSGALLAGTSTITLSGANAADLTDAGGTAVSTLTSSDGTFVLGLRSGVAPTAAAPVEFVVSVARPGSVPASVPVRLTATGSASVRVALLGAQADTTGKVTGLTEATGQQTATVATTAGSIPANTGSGADAAFVAQAVFTPTAPDAPVQQVAAEVKVPPTVTAGREVGWVLVPAPAGPIVAQVITALPVSLETAALVPSVPLTPPPATPPATLPAYQGIAKVNIFDSAGNPINKFSAPITLALDLVPGTVNPQTGQPFKVGDAVKIVSFDENARAWVERTTGIVTANAVTGNLRAEFQTDRLSYFAIALEQAVCTTTVSFSTSTPRTLDARIFAYSGTGNSYVDFNKTGVAVAPNDPLQVVAQVPTGGRIDVQLTDPKLAGQAGFTAASFSGEACVTETASIAAPAGTGALVVTVRETFDATTCGVREPRAIPSSKVFLATTSNAPITNADTSAAGQASFTGLSFQSLNAKAIFTESDNSAGEIRGVINFSTNNQTAMLQRTVTCQSITGG